MKYPGSTFSCLSCGQEKPAGEGKPLELVPDPLVEELRKRKPDLPASGFVCARCRSALRASYMQRVLEEERGELTALEKQVLDSLREHELVSENVNLEFEERLTPGQRVADRVATFGGSWPFIFTFGGTLAVWIALNTIGLMRKPFDPYPYILLNLLLSCLAAIQAPVIMMSQNRREAKDRLRSEHDYRVNLKAELEIRNLHAKLDELMTHQWQRLIEIQTMQMELLEESRRRGKTGG